MIDIKLCPTPLDTRACETFVASDDAGAVVSFAGKVRNNTQGKKVLRLEFEAYEPMAIAEMQKIAKEALALFELKKVAIHHRTGRLSIGEIAVVIAVSSAHRKNAFSACAFCIDTLKQKVPIWKKEIFEDGEVWVSALP